jgi:drug/metabolite transporter (DMT)-like permease
LIAVRSAPVGYVATLRETSVVLSALAGWQLLGERLGRTRLASSAIVVAGLIGLVVAR